MQDEGDVFGARPVRRPASHEIGQSLDALSLHEIDERVELLRAEIVRLQEAHARKKNSLASAAAVFKS